MTHSTIRGSHAPACSAILCPACTQSKEVIAAVQKAAADIGGRLKALNPDLWIIFSNDPGSYTCVHGNCDVGINYVEDSSRRRPGGPHRYLA